MLKKSILVFIALAVLLLTGCASVPMESPGKSEKLKAFNSPSDGMAGLYIYREAGVGAALKKDIWVNEECVGESAQEVFFYKEVPGDERHSIATESEFSPNVISLETEKGKNYFIKQYIKMGVFVGGANLKLVGEEEGRNAVSELDLAVSGTCSS
ncbi:DUF2846 domain-containing protein [Halomonas denitrificans]|uniref:DUF2846 domain-containing protein n=1 Tax=Halomonas denitrificans TaxID=370769 RepID=UPI000D352A89|nr:DUF2846 domain-containing protein [Halomonas denitrificans]